MDLPHRDAPGIQGQDLVSEPCPPCLVLGRDLSLKAAIANSWNIDGKFAKSFGQLLEQPDLSGVLWLVQAI
jgi:hypothetical protein